MTKKLLVLAPLLASLKLYIQDFQMNIAHNLKPRNIALKGMSSSDTDIIAEDKPQSQKLNSISLHELKKN